MKLTKDEARLLSYALDIAYEAICDNKVPGYNKALDELEARLFNHGMDNRRNGRTSQNDWSDLLVRIGQKHLKEGGES